MIYDIKKQKSEVNFIWPQIVIDLIHPIMNYNLQPSTASNCQIRNRFILPTEPTPLTTRVPVFVKIADPFPMFSNDYV